jgi:hypothetical protein
MDWGGITAVTSINNLLAMKAQPQTEYRLIHGEQNLRVWLTNVQVFPMLGVEQTTRQVSFQFYVVDGPKRK